MRRLCPAALAAFLATILALIPSQSSASQWGSHYGDPTGFCPEQSYLPATYAVVVTNDPLVRTNPERDTFWGWHANPGYDDWYGRWYGSFRGRTADDSGWHWMMRDVYGQVGHWNFADYGWAVRGHAKQYIAYYNWTFGGSCGMGVYGSMDPAPYMADVIGYPVVDIYVDSTPPFPPRPRVTAMEVGLISFSWDPVVDRGDGIGVDYYASGMDHYTSWLSIDGGPPLQQAATANPRTLTARGLARGQTACAQVSASDRLGNTTSVQQACGRSLEPPPIPDLDLRAGEIRVNPVPIGLVGLETRFWLEPAPQPISRDFEAGGLSYRVTATPSTVSWTFGDGAEWRSERASATHVYQAHSAAGYGVDASARYDLQWSVLVDGRWLGPHPLPGRSVTAQRLTYRVVQAQPELVARP
jgi:hypothetical protein